MGVSQGPHRPLTQRGSAVVQTLPHAPQFIGSLVTRRSQPLAGLPSQSWSMLIGNLGQSGAASAAGESLAPASPPDEGASAPQLVTRIARRVARNVRMGQRYEILRSDVTGELSSAPVPRTVTAHGVRSRVLSKGQGIGGRGRRQRVSGACSARHRRGSRKLPLVDVVSVVRRRGERATSAGASDHCSARGIAFPCCGRAGAAREGASSASPASVPSLRRHRRPGHRAPHVSALRIRACGGGAAHAVGAA